MSNDHLKSPVAYPASEATFAPAGDTTFSDDSIYNHRLYREEGLWCFDAPELAIYGEPFVAGTDSIPNHLRDNHTQGVANPILMFSAEPIVGSTMLHWQRAEKRGEQDEEWNLYYSPDLEMEGWLCPRLLAFYPEAPEFLHVRLVDKPNITPPSFRLFHGTSEASEHGS